MGRAAKIVKVVPKWPKIGAQILQGWPIILHARFEKAKSLFFKLLARIAIAIVAGAGNRGFGQVSCLFVLRSVIQRPQNQDSKAPTTLKIS